MPIPDKAHGYGNNSTAQNVLRITFSQALSAAPKYEAWDNSQVFPAKDASGSTTAKTIFAGTAGNSNKPMLCLVDTNTAPASAWKPATATAGSANPNRLKGTTNYVTAGNTPGAGQSIRCNMVLEMPYDVTTSDTFEHILQIRYSYTGTAPTLTWAFNESPAAAPDAPSAWVALTAYSVGNYVIPTTANGYIYECTVAGTSAAGEPSWPTVEGNTVVDGTVTWKCWAMWTTMTPGTHGIRHCKAGAGAGNYYATVPETGTQDTEEGWVTT